MAARKRRGQILISTICVMFTASIGGLDSLPDQITRVAADTQENCLDMAALSGSGWTGGLTTTVVQHWRAPVEGDASGPWESRTTVTAALTLVFSPTGDSGQGAAAGSFTYAEEGTSGDGRWAVQRSLVGTPELLRLESGDLNIAVEDALCPGDHLTWTGAGWWVRRGINLYIYRYQVDDQGNRQRFGLVGDGTVGCQPAGSPTPVPAPRSGLCVNHLAAPMTLRIHHASCDTITGEADAEALAFSAFSRRTEASEAPPTTEARRNEFTLQRDGAQAEPDDRCTVR